MSENAGVSNVMENLELIELASRTVSIKFDYVNQKGEKKSYEVEPYDYNESLFYGYDVNELKTKSFKYEKMSNVLLGYAFTPRFESK